MDQKVRRHFRFYGTVQGVGFRFQAMMAAESLGLTGWVKNENDGSVTMEIQGSEEEIQSAIDLIANSRFIRIERTESELIPLVEHESSFGAEYW
ncbi:MAG: acylphosphatase [Erysipelotrichaceae bacterium]|nr:acylphosphatase [Erysipelotrichaceae bacterium]